jgi:hypothetical protein
VTTYEVLSEQVPPGRWVITMQAGQLVEGDALGSDGNFFFHTRFKVDGVERSLQRTGFFIINQVYEVIDTHRYSTTETFTADTDVSIEVGFTYDGPATTPSWNLYSFGITAFPG